MDSLLGFPLHIPTLAFARGLIEIVLSGLIAFVGVRERQVRGPIWWTLGFVVNGFSLQLFTIQSNDWGRALTVANHLCLGLSNAFLLIGFWVFNGRTVRRNEQLILGAILTIPVLSLLLWEVVWPNAQFRILTSICSHFIFYLALQATLAQPPRVELAPLSSGLRFLVVAYAFYAAWSYARVAGLLPTTADAPTDYHRATFSAASLLFMLALAVGCLALMFIRIASRNADLAMTDWLTGLSNRRGLVKLLERVDIGRQREASTTSIMTLDIDHFKRINDVHGHAGGDLVICRVADVLKSCVRAGDITARLGGEEFTVVLPNSDGQTALQIAERIRQNCSAVPVGLDHGAQASFSVSIGVCEVMQHETSMTALDRADVLLYQAKNSGRNCVVGPGIQP